MRKITAILTMIGVMWVGETFLGDGALFVILVALVIRAYIWLQEN